ncbi:MAG TPA: DNA-deoxyinosine glycosylase [Mycobacterium sp.]|nr:DNA-deoxyinosine glycosylase [Mycobacterium sp.]
MPTSLPPVVDDRTRVLVLGSMPGEMSLRMQQYYAHPRNAFWCIMNDIIGFDVQADYPRRLEALRSAGIGLWDVLSFCERSGSLDSAIARDTMEANDFEALFTQYPGITRVFFNGAAAEQAFVRLVAPRIDLSVKWSRLPSTSPANAAMPYDAKLRAWRSVLDVR